uniref:Nose resistant to fluoxetine protein 6-like n=1 Tax=Diabrotica virgifera virgifera TaxID=50390 RepID=A0A6P7H384_DIAVI
MIESTSRIATSKSSYDYGDSGHFEECIEELQSKEDHIKGKYCIADITYQYMNFTSEENPVLLKDLTLRITGGMHMLRFPTRAVCLPSNCSDADAGFIMKKLQYSNTTIKSLMCQTKEEVYEPLDRNAYVGIVIIVLIAIVVFLATMYDLYCQKYTQERGKPGLVAFSVYTNGKKLLQTSNNRTSSLDCLDGIRVLSMIWVMTFHMYVKYIAVPVFNSKESIQISGGILGILFTTGHLACDALFIVGGTLVTYVYFSRTKEGDLTLYTIIKHYIHRYIRLTPALIGVIIVVATLIKYTGSGPKWPVVDTLYQEGCQKYWWSTILYIHNEVYVDNMCVAHTWYIAVDTQLYIISPLIFYMLKKHTKIGVTCIIFAILASITVAFVKGYDGNIIATVSDAYYANVDVAFVMLYFYLSTVTRAAPWFMGTLLGYLLTRTGFKKPLSQVILTT